MIGWTIGSPSQKDRKVMTQYSLTRQSVVNQHALTRVGKHVQIMFENVSIWPGSLLICLSGSSMTPIIH